MSVEVIFRGPMLFRRKEKDPPKVPEPDDKGRVFTLDGIWVPDGEDTTITEHPDTTSARRHYSRMIVFDAVGNPAVRLDLRETRVTISDEFDGDCNVLPSFDELPDFNKVLGSTAAKRPDLISEKDADFNDRVTTQVELKGGAIGAVSASGQEWVPPIHPEGAALEPTLLAFQASWKSQSATARLKVHDRNDNTWTEIILDAARPKAFLYNFDTEWPTLGELGGNEEPQRRGTVIDEDFKWLYRLFNPPGGGGGTPAQEAAKWRKWLGPRKSLPAPEADLVRRVGGIARNPGSAGCFGAFIGP
jgi:hypothetical protein